MRSELYEMMHQAGQTMLAARDVERVVSQKEGTANFVTAYDVAVQQQLRQKLLALRPGAAFIGEEEDARGDVLHGEAFIVDPIDGTTNFIKHYDRSAISVGYARDGVMQAGAVYDPYRDEFYYAERGRGASCNGQPLHLPDLPLAECLVCFGTSPYYAELADRSFALARHLVDHALDLRRSGSAAIDLCALAHGRAGLMFELRLSPWDYAASSLIVTEAGGRIGQLDGSPLVFDRPCGVLAATPTAWADFFAAGLAEG